MHCRQQEQQRLQVLLLGPGLLPELLLLLLAG